ncbi:DNA sulfur modification protein DndD [Xanthomonas sp. WHRI 10064A]|uniref:DNA sulfur modification protein DndD n=1 Tax=unclassified Xanthomonas TaxID=2643310 RepID=UPI002B237A6E|nr:MULTISPECIES: DNA sulfur modification protein DndD [unclassified Xanthomonas]MEA9589201.1 DNA sulfur modification protein DndD [Xanthomonas sp. WHRI 10064B]MEA9616876.1 DNA sulfur modification protein DndD [Xanthomonas sp. WHRI 10064A]
MILKSVTVQNVGVYRGRHTLELAGPSKTKPITAVLALNGSGKTTLLESLRIGLYGRRSPSFSNGRGYERHLKDFIHRGTPASEVALVEIELQVRTEGVMHTYLVCRSWDFSDPGTISEDLSVSLDGIVDAVLSDTWADTIEQWLPAQLSLFCFFDGEQLAALADPAQSQQVLQNAVRTLLGLDLVDQLTDDLKILERRRKERALGDGEKASIAPLREAAELADIRVQELVLQRGGLVNRAERSKRELNSATEALQTAGGAPDAQRQRLLAQRDAAEAHWQGQGRQLREHAYGLAPLLLVKGALQRFGQNDPLVGSARALDELQSRDAWLVHQLSPLVSDAKLAKQVAALLAQDRETRLRQLSLTAAPPQVTEAVSQLPSIEATLQASLFGTREAVERLDQIDRELERLPDKNDASAPHQVWQSAVVEQSAAEATLATCDQQLAQARRIREEASSRYQATLERSVRDEQARREAGLISTRSDELRGTLDTFRAAMLQRHAKRLGDLVSECFALLHHKAGMVDTIRVDPKTLSMSLVDGNGTLLPADRLSAGERQLLAISTIWAILRASGRPLPLVIDTPLGRLDSIHRSSLVQRFFVRASHQVVLLATDTELDESVRTDLAEATGATYHIEHVTTEGRSELRRTAHILTGVSA